MGVEEDLAMKSVLKGPFPTTPLKMIDNQLTQIWAT